MKSLYFSLLLLCLSSFAEAQACFPSAECEDAPLFCGYALENTLFDNESVSFHTSTPPSCIPGLHNSSWFAIVPCAPQLRLSIWSQSCAGAGSMQAALFSDCFPSTVIACNSNSSFDSFFTLEADVVPGQTYLLQVDGNDGSICVYSISVISGLDVSLPPAPMATVGGAISGPTGGLCNGSGSPIASYTASWPGCDAFSSPQLSCYTPPADSCNGIKWTLPPGAIVVGDPYANPVTVNLQFVVAGTYTIRAKPMECGCPDLCDECGQACCPVEELSLQITIGGSCNEDCSDFENPAPPGDNCTEAPFLCGNYLDGYCSSNAGLSNDTLNGMVLRNSGFLRLSPCDDSLHLRIRARNCTSSNGLIAWLMRGTCDEPELIGSVAITNGAFSDFIFNDLTPDETYFLVFEGGPLGTICELYIEVVSGIGTATPDGSNVTCDCTNGSIDGPSDLCPADVAVYTLSPGSCTIIDGPPTVGSDPGNGYFCCPESSEDSFQLVWHIPSSMNFLSDSINVNTITVQVDSNLLGRDTLIMDSIWISYEFITPPDAAVDSLIYCDCPGYSGCLPGISAKQVTIRHDVEMEFCELTCVMPFCIIEGVTYTAPTSDTLQSNCLTRIIQIIDNQVPPPVFIAPVLPLNCANPTRTLSVNTPMQNTFIQWDGPGIVTNPNAPSITVNAQGFYNCIVTSFLTGCVSAAQVFVGSNFIEPTVVISPDNSICQGGSIEIGSSGSSVGTNFQYNWSTGATTTFIQVSPNVTTTYSLTITNLTNGCEETASMTVTVEPLTIIQLNTVAQITCAQPCVTYLGNEYCAPGTYQVETFDCEITRFTIGEDLSLPTITLPIVTLCEGECYTFYGQEYCASAVLTQEDNCNIFVQEIVVNSPTLIDLGEVAEITCAQPCVTYLGNEYCAAGTYEVQTGACEISRFIIGEDLSLPTITLPIVTLCEGECYTFYGQEYCASAVLMQEDNCSIFVQEIVVNPPTIVQAGVVGSISCGEPCFSFMGTNYCATGQYVDTTDCLLTVFDIEFAKDTQDVGLLGTLTCSQSCFSFLQELYCEAGDYVVSDTCTIFRFSIASNVSAPVCSTPILNCLPSNAQYTVGFSISGTPPYKVNGEPISGSYFLSDPIASGTDYAFIVEQVNNDCQTLLNGIYDCAAACANDPGALQTNTLHTCTGDQATAQVLTPAVVPTGQVAEFILHTLSGNTLGVVLARNTDGVFAFDAETMVAEETYYISSAAGPADAEGLVDFTNACAKIAPGQPVIFHALPEFGSILSENPSCFGEADGFIHALHAHATSPLQYALNAGIFSNQFLFEGLEAEAYTLRLRDAFGCQRDTVLTLVEPDSLWLTLTPDQEITRGETIVLQAETNAGAGLPVWTNDQNAAQQEGFDLEVQPQATTRYFCTVSNGNDCIVSGSLLLKVRSGQVYFPNVIAPRGADASNQGFTLFAPEGYLQEIRSLKIFDRWGATVFQRNHFAPNMPELGWDGSIRGRAANSAVFVFMAEVLLPDGSIEIISGDVTVL